MHIDHRPMHMTFGGTCSACEASTASPDVRKRSLDSSLQHLSPALACTRRGPALFGRHSLTSVHHPGRLCMASATRHEAAAQRRSVEMLSLLKSQLRGEGSSRGRPLAAKGLSEGLETAKEGSRTLSFFTEDT